MKNQHFIMMMNLILLTCPESAHGMERLQGLLGIRRNPSGQTNMSSLVPVAAGVAGGLAIVAVGKLAQHHYRASARHTTRRGGNSASRQDANWAQGAGASSSAQATAQQPVGLNAIMHKQEQIQTKLGEVLGGVQGTMQAIKDSGTQMSEYVQHVEDPCNDHQQNLAGQRKKLKRIGKRTAAIYHLQQQMIAHREAIAQHSARSDCQLGMIQALTAHVSTLDQRLDQPPANLAPAPSIDAPSTRRRSRSGSPCILDESLTAGALSSDDSSPRPVADLRIRGNGTVCLRNPGMTSKPRDRATTSLPAGEDDVECPPSTSTSPHANRAASPPKSASQVYAAVAAAGAAKGNSPKAATNNEPLPGVTMFD